MRNKQREVYINSAVYDQQYLLFGRFGTKTHPESRNDCSCSNATIFEWTPDVAATWQIPWPIKPRPTQPILSNPELSAEDAVGVDENSLASSLSAADAEEELRRRNFLPDDNIVLEQTNTILNSIGGETKIHKKIN